ncbi:YdeI family stress tolerance OB fold protein [Citrobacter freundii]|uniref:YdeI family stress tolerance OB fold protein n=1 Tax=Citrobacter freundii TaxID=546 RepID=UPI0006679430|nr:YdeI family stress tolerance OB fold protein [Citrobacter freundii]ELO3997250.1 YdeI family stress tolerance OB fold protein [Citrobacter freundii]MCU0184881.1 YdeI family stress tolerance OB fold protein [Citrobacter freundii]HCA5746080.1 YdeI family stress tolerance OB fold protein [Citrobacter freundii]HCJ7774556.1 YdeI family stress tolerance OB fold protein [Citrobacter freundii]HCT4952794.1 YdeI family stress tolerance OB fold protein [Citrobacter freundii]
MRLYVAPLIYCFLIPTVFADDENGGLKKDTAPPPPHALDEGYRGTENARIMTVQQAKSMHDGATISLRGNLIDGQGGDKFVFRDKTGSIHTLIPHSVFDGRTVKPDQMISINGSLDTKTQPPVVRVNRIQK